MSIQPLKDKLITLLVVGASVGGTLAVFGSVPVIARITANQQAAPPQYTQHTSPGESSQDNWL